MILERANLYDARSASTRATLTTRPLCGAWTAKDVLAHMTGGRLQYPAPARPADGPDPAPLTSRPTLQRRQVARRQALPFATVLPRPGGIGLRSTLDEYPPTALARPLGRAESAWPAIRAPSPSTTPSTREHVTWRKEAEPAAGPRGPLARPSQRPLGCRATRRPPARRARHGPICGPWTAMDVVGHLADWMLLMAEAAARCSGRALPPARERRGAGRLERRARLAAAHSRRRSGGLRPRSGYSALSAIELGDEGLAAATPAPCPNLYQWFCHQRPRYRACAPDQARLERT